MSKSEKILLVVGIALVLIVGYLVTHPKIKLFGANQCGGIQTCLASIELTGAANGATNTLQIDAGAENNAGTFQLGASGSIQSNQVNTTCSPKADVSITATSSGYAYCLGVAGVTSTDQVDAQFSTSTANFVLTTDEFFIMSAKSSTTPGAIDFLVYNGTGKNNVPSAVGRAASTTTVQAGH